VITKFVRAIRSRAIDPDAQEHINTGFSSHEFRSTRTVLGDGFVEAINSNTLAAILATSSFTGEILVECWDLAAGTLSVGAVPIATQDLDRNYSLTAGELVGAVVEVHQ
jgi:hypothetical protein